MENENQEEEEQGTMKQWLQDNLRIIISIIIVIAIAGGIYSYSKRTATPEEQTKQTAITEELGSTSEQGATTQQPSESGKITPEKSTGSTTTTQVTSQETEKSFIETAVKGDSSTKLARRALANYLEKNPDSELTPEHKIYIEDYLRKHVSFKGKVFIGTSVEFSKELVKEAITKSKTLNDSQLKNLHKYSVRVPSLS